MIRTTIIRGINAVTYYNKTKEIPSVQWLKANGGVVDNISFQTKAEYNIYMQALSDNKGWGNYAVIESEQRQEDCPFCRQWREFFADKQTTVYCPDCGQPILNS